MSRANFVSCSSRRASESRSASSWSRPRSNPALCAAPPERGPRPRGGDEREHPRDHPAAQLRERRERLVRVHLRDEPPGRVGDLLDTRRGPGRPGSPRPSTTPCSPAAARAHGSSERRSGTEIPRARRRRWRGSFATDAGRPRRGRGASPRWRLGDGHDCTIRKSERDGSMRRRTASRAPPRRADGRGDGEVERVAGRVPVDVGHDRAPLVDRAPDDRADVARLEASSATSPAEKRTCPSSVTTRDRGVLADAAEHVEPGLELPDARRRAAGRPTAPRAGWGRRRSCRRR